MGKNPLHSQELLSQLLECDPATGKLFWKKRPTDLFSGSSYPLHRAASAWNSKWAGTEAFTYKGTNGYLQGRLFRVSFFAHRVIWAMVNDEWPEQIDHINGVRDDNRLCNLRGVSNAENRLNQKLPITNTSGVIGVSWCKRAKRWQARLELNRKQNVLGLFDSFEAACIARKAAEVANGFHENHGRPM